MEAPPIMNIVADTPKSLDLIYCSSCKNIPEIKIENKGKEILFSKICKFKPESEKSINDLIKIIFHNKENKKYMSKRS